MMKSTAMTFELSPTITAQPCWHLGEGGGQSEFSWSFSQLCGASTYRKEHTDSMYVYAYVCMHASPICGLFEVKAYAGSKPFIAYLA